MNAPAQKPAGMHAFTIVWAGQLFSLLGSAMTLFALSYWAFTETGQATAVSLIIFFFFAPSILLSPVAGALVDRWNRKLVMMLSDLGAAIATGILLVLYSTDLLQLWHIYLTGILAGIFNAFQFPAYSAAISTMLPKEQFTRASAMISLAESASGVLAPLVAGALLVYSTLHTIFAIDIITCTIAVLALLVVSIPQPPKTAEGEAGRGNLWQESIYGFRYIFRRPSLLSLQLLFTTVNFTFAFTTALLAPMILARTANNAQILGTVQSAAGVGGIVGGLLLSAWGGPKRRIYGVIVGLIGSSLIGQSLLGLGRSLPVWIVASFVMMVFIPVLNGSSQAIWQSKVAPDVQGRVFSVRALIGRITLPVATLLAGPLADRFFEPALAEGGTLVPAVGWLVGSGPGAGMALLIVMAGIIGGLAAALAFLIPAIRLVEDRLPDHVIIAPAGSAP